MLLYTELLFFSGGVPCDKSRVNFLLAMTKSASACMSTEASAVTLWTVPKSHFRPRPRHYPQGKSWDFNELNWLHISSISSLVTPTKVVEQWKSWLAPEHTPITRQSSSPSRTILKRICALWLIPNMILSYRIISLCLSCRPPPRLKLWKQPCHIIYKVMNTVVHKHDANQDPYYSWQRQCHGFAFK